MYTVRLSVIIPVFNVEQYIRRCLDSILCQAYEGLEILLIDDGSTDASGQLCDEYAANDDRIRVFHQANSGVSASRNRGLKEAKGEWIYFVDSDDWLEKELFMSFEKVRSENPDMDIYKFGFYRDGANKTTNVCDDRQKILRNSMDIFVTTEKNHYHAFVWNMIFKKQLADNLWFEEEICWCEDHIFTLTLYTKAHALFVDNKMLYHYLIRGRGASLSSVDHDPYMLCKAIKLEAEAKKACLTGKPQPHILATINRTYHALIKNAIRCLYKQSNSYRERKDFFCFINKNLNRMTDFKYTLKYNYYYPFLRLFTSNRRK